MSAKKKQILHRSCPLHDGKDVIYIRLDQEPFGIGTSTKQVYQGGRRININVALTDGVGHLIERNLHYATGAKKHAALIEGGNKHPRVELIRMCTAKRYDLERNLTGFHIYINHLRRQNKYKSPNIPHIVVENKYKSSNLFFILTFIGKSIPTNFATDKNNMEINMKATFFILTSLCILATSCSSPHQQTERVPSVKVDTVRTASTESVLQYPGRVKAAQDANLSFRVSGNIRSIKVNDGQTVKAGQLLAELDPTDYEIQLQGTEAQYQQVKSEAERVIALYKDGGTTPANYDKAVYGLQQITALYQHHKDELAYTRLYAPFNGTIQKRFMEAHETVGAGMPVLSMIGTDAPEVEISLPAAEYIRREHFNDYRCTFDIYPGKVFPLRLIGISPKANANQLYTMRLQLITGNDLPTPSAGMNVLVEISLTTDGIRTLQVPTTALLNKDGKSRVYLYLPDTQSIESREVEMLQLLDNDCCLITSPTLQAGDIIVSAGIHTLKEGEKVRPLPPVSETNVGGLL